MVKFRTMRDEIGDDGLPLRTPNALLRLDVFYVKVVSTIPELDVLKGDMSLVGPRPLLIMLSLYSPQQAR